MNERIRELALEAGAGEWDDAVIPAMMDIEKFSELLVRECAQFICVLDAEPVSLIRAARMLQEHFGIE